MDTFIADFFKAFSYSYEKPWFFTEYSFLLCFSFFLFGYAFVSKHKTIKSVYLILFSLFFYYKSSGPFLFLFIGIITCDFFLARFLNRLEGVKRKMMLVLTLIYSLSFLLYFKYANFIINKGEAKASDVLALMKEVRRQVQQKQGKVLQPEIIALGREWKDLL
mgnify:CR=1 FL=1